MGLACESVAEEFVVICQRVPLARPCFLPPRLDFYKVVALLTRGSPASVKTPAPSTGEPFSRTCNFLQEQQTRRSCNADTTVSRRSVTCFSASENEFPDPAHAAFPLSPATKASSVNTARLPAFNNRSASSKPKSWMVFATSPVQPV